MLSVTVLTLWVAPPTECSATGIGLMEPKPILWNGTHFRHPTDELLRHVDIFFSNYYNLQSVHAL